MGKTTTLFQVADGLLEIGSGTPLIVLLGDWATEGGALLASILKRPAFNGISEQDFRAVASKPGVVLLLDDVGQTFGYWGIPAGPYLVIPFLGPSNIRDATGLVIQSYIDPVSGVTPDSARYELWGLRVIDARAGLLGTEDLLSGAALDRYTFIRSAYSQRRRSLIYDGKPPKDNDE